MAALIELVGPSRLSWAGQPYFKKIFNGKDGCFILFDQKLGRPITEYNKKRCAERVFACSTFKIPIALMAFDRGILKDENTVIPWDGVDRRLPAWNGDQTPRTWLKYSTVWVSQWITPQIGAEKIKKYLSDFRYGNQDISGGITRAWLSSTLKISAEEQLDFFARFWKGQLPVSSRAVDLVKKSMDSERSESGAILHGKTGSGFLDGRDHPDGRRVGWFVGHLLQGNHEYLFVTNFSDIAKPEDPGPAGERGRAITKSILREMKLF